VDPSTSKKIYWICFAAVQIVGFVSPYSANVHSNPFPLFLGVILLLPGILLGSATDRWNPKPEWLANVVFGVIVVLINAGVWYAVRRLYERRQKPPESPASPTPTF